MPEMIDPYGAWKNKIRKLEKIDSLRVIWAYHNFNAFWTPISEDIIVPQEFYDEWNRWMRFISAFYLISYLRDILAYAWNIQRYTLRDWGQFWFLQNQVEHLSVWNYIDDEDINKRLSISLFESAHQQFKWKEIQRDNFHYINSYSILYSNEIIDNLTKEILGIWSKRILEIWFLFFAGIMSNFSMRIDHSLVSNDELEIFLNIFWVRIEELSRKLRHTHDDSFSFKFSWIRELINNPIILLEEGLYISPMPHLLLRWIFEWIFFKCINSGGFGSRFWEIAFQDFCHKILFSGLSSDHKIGTDKELLSTMKTKETPRNPDFYIESRGCILFLDAKYTSIPEKFFVNIKSFSEVDTSKFIGNIKQWFDFVKNYRSWVYSNIIQNIELKEFIIFLTPFDTFFTFGVPWYTLMDEMIKTLKDSWDFLDVDFIFMWINELHRFMQLGSKYWFREILDMKFNEKFKSYEMLGFMNEISENWYDIEYSQYDFEWYDFMSEIEAKYKPQ